MNYRDIAVQHLTSFFACHSAEELRWSKGPMAEDEDFVVMHFEPGAKSDLWAYVSVGASRPATDSPRLEFVVLSPRADARIVELIAMIAHYHRTEGLRHMLPIGEPWLEAASCDCFLISLPYPFGPALEWLQSGSSTARFLWLLPITSAERQYARTHGIEALEERFDEAKLEYWNLRRRSVA